MSVDPVLPVGDAPHSSRVCDFLLFRCVLLVPVVFVVVFVIRVCILVHVLVLVFVCRRRRRSIVIVRPSSSLTLKKGLRKFLILFSVVAVDNIMHEGLGAGC